jgi:Xaa-Pro dipeptidase
MAIIKPGVHWDAVQRHCHVVLARGFIRLGIFKSPPAPDPETALIRAGVTVPFFPHGVGHSVGLDLHDVPSASKPPESLGKGHPELDIYKYLRLRRPLKAGMVVVRSRFLFCRALWRWHFGLQTVEPGIYFHPYLLASVRDSPYINHTVLARYERGTANYGGVGGVRIEDVVLVTENGYENLTLVRSDRAWVEDVCGGKL